MDLTAYGTPKTDAKVFCSVDPNHCFISDLTIENVERGIYWWGGNVGVEGCLIRAFHNDFIGLAGSPGGGSATDCEFEFSDVGRGSISHNFTGGFTFQGCAVRGFGSG